MHGVDAKTKKLRAAFDRELDGLCRDVAAFPWEDRDAYAHWLLNTRAYVEHTTRLTALAAAHLPQTADGLHKRLLAHAAEELGHEQLLTADIGALGVRVDDGDVLPITTAFAECMYYEITHLSPLALFGRVLPLEGVSARESARARERVVRTHGPGVDAFLRVHGDADPTHVAEAFTALENVDESDLAVVERGMQLTSALYRAMLAAIVARRR